MLIKIGDCWVDPQEIAAVRDLFEPGDESPALQVVLRNTGEIMIGATMDEAEAALIDAGVIENPYPEEKEAQALTDGEAEELSALYDEGYAWLARDGRATDKGCTLFAFADKPARTGDIWQSASATVMVNAPFVFIKADDAEPWSIPFLLLDAWSQA